MARIEDDEITCWLEDLSQGDPLAAQAIWEAYFERLVSLARKKLGDFPRREADEEDVALSAMHSFYRGMKAGRFAHLADRDDLWKVLVTITARKARALIRRHKATKRGGGHLRGESVFLRLDGEEGEVGIGQIMGREPTPELAHMVADNCRQLLDCLDNETLRQVAVYKLEGYTNDEIAAELDCVTRSVERKLERIRAAWSKLAAADG